MNAATVPSCLRFDKPIRPFLIETKYLLQCRVQVAQLLKLYLAFPRRNISWANNSSFNQQCFISQLHSLACCIDKKGTLLKTLLVFLSLEKCKLDKMLKDLLP